MLLKSWLCFRDLGNLKHGLKDFLEILIRSHSIDLATARGHDNGPLLVAGKKGSAESTLAVVRSLHLFRLI